MYAELFPLTVSDVADQLGIRRTEVLRLRVCCVQHTGALHITDEQVQEMATFAGIFSLTDRISEASENQYHGSLWLLPILQVFIDEGWVDTVTVRMDNIWRGLPKEEARILQEMTYCLVRDQILKIYSSNRGKQIAISENHLETVREMVSGQFLPPSISEFMDSES